MPMPRASKGKGRAVMRDEGMGGAEGRIVSLDVTSSSAFDIAYTLNVYFGATQQKLSLQVDTGSSDLWVTSKSCTSSLCSQVDGHYYDPSGSNSTEKTFQIAYLSGQVSGPIVWDSVQIGGYTIENQAFAAADDIQNEPLSPQFDGVLGLALPLNSIIAGAIPPVTGNSPDGAAWASNLFSITPVSSAPTQRFLSLSLSRPGSSQVPALLGIGAHPPDLIPDPSRIQYDTLVSDRPGILFWKVSVRAITVYVNGQPRPVELGMSSSGAAFPSAVLDSGVPLIFTTAAVANAIYGAIGISPASDGSYYVPCTTPLNLTFTIDNRTETSIHPLDLTTEPPQDPQSSFCVGLIQTADVLSDPTAHVGDMILGVPFLRNVYTVMAYAAPSNNGTFPQTNATTTGANIVPRLGLLGLTNATEALQEFERVRVLNQPIDSNPGTSGGSGGNAGGTTGKAGKGISVGIIALIAILGFFALCFILFGLRWWLFRRRFRRAGAGPGGGSGLPPIGITLGGAEGDGKGGTIKEKKKDDEFLRNLPPTDEVLRMSGYEAYMQYNQAANDDSVTTETSEGRDLESPVVGANGKRWSRESQEEQHQGHTHSGSGADELGYRRVGSGETWRTDPDVTLVVANLDGGAEDEGSKRKEWDPEDLYVVEPPKINNKEDRDAVVIWPYTGHDRKLSVTTPLLEEDEGSGDGGDEFGVVSTMAGVGTAARGARVGAGLKRESDVSEVGVVRS